MQQLSADIVELAWVWSHPQARSQGGFEGVRTNPPLYNLVKFNFFKARQQQSFNRAVVVLLQTAYKPSYSCYTAINYNTACMYCKRASCFYKYAVR